VSFSLSVGLGNWLATDSGYVSRRLQKYPFQRSSPRNGTTADSRQQKDSGIVALA
jgi:hypothetical protein